jgi:hypothetical protein
MVQAKRRMSGNAANYPTLSASFSDIINDLANCSPFIASTRMAVGSRLTCFY